MAECVLYPLIIAAATLAMVITEARRWRAIDQIDEPKRRPAASKSKDAAHE